MGSNPTGPAKIKNRQSMTSIFASADFTIFSTLIIFILSFGLALLISKKYRAKKQEPYLYWSIGIWLFALGVFLEVLFAVGVTYQLLIIAYLFTVSLIVNFLAFGSVKLIKGKIYGRAYAIYSIATEAILAYFLAATRIGNIIINHIVYGILPLNVVTASSLVTFPAAILLIAIAIKSYAKGKSKKMLSIIIGVIIVSIAGTLYIVQVPAFLYYSEFVGILLLWYGLI